jgi:hypothetical protein
VYALGFRRSLSASPARLPLSVVPQTPTGRKCLELEKQEAMTGLPTEGVSSVAPRITSARRFPHMRAHANCLGWGNCEHPVYNLDVAQSDDFFVYKKNQLGVTFCVLYFSSNSCPTCFGQPCAHHQELTTA